jgi:Transglycosylase SLT domain
MAQVQRAGSRERVDVPGLIRAAAAKYRIPEPLLAALVQVESSGNPRALSKKGAMGLGQLMPATAEALGVTDPFDPVQNLNATAKHLSNLLTKYGGNTVLALAAYNAGEPAVDKVKGVPDYPETVGYIKKIDKELGRQVKSTAVDAPSGSPAERTPVGAKRPPGDYIAVDRGGRPPPGSAGMGTPVGYVPPGSGVRTPGQHAVSRTGDVPYEALNPKIAGAPGVRMMPDVGAKRPPGDYISVDRSGRPPGGASAPRDPGYGVTEGGRSVPTQQNRARIKDDEVPGLGKISDQAMQQVLDQLATERATAPMDVDMSRQYEELQPGPYGMEDEAGPVGSDQPSLAPFYSGGTFPQPSGLGTLARLFRPSGGRTFTDYTPSER